MCCESALDAFALAVQCGGSGVSVSDSGREHGFGAPRLPALRSVRTARGSERPRPRLQRHAPRLGGFINTGGDLRFLLGVPRLPRGHKNPRGSRLAVWFERAPIRCGVARRALAGRLPARHRDNRDSGTGLRLSAPTSASADHAAGGSSVDGGILPPRHESLTRKILITILAAIGPKADFGACHYPFRTNPHPFAGRGSDRRQPRRAAPEPASAEQRAERIAPAASLRRGPSSPRHRRGRRPCARRARSALAKLTARATPGIAARATLVRAAGGDRAGRLWAARRRPPAQPTPTQPGCASGRRRNEHAPMSLRFPRLRKRLHSGPCVCKTVMVLPCNGVSGVPRAPAPSGRARHEQHPHRVGLDRFVGRLGAPSCPCRASNGRRGDRCGAHRVARGLSPDAQFRY